MSGHIATDGRAIIQLNEGDQQMTAFLWHGNSGEDSERRAWLPLDERMCVLFSVPLPEINPGDLLQAWATFEATNDTRHAVVMVCRYLTIGTTPDDINGIHISEAAGRNVTKDMHHDTHHDFGSWVATTKLAGRYLNLVTYAGHVSATPGEWIRIETDYGRLQATIHDASVVKPATPLLPRAVRPTLPAAPAPAPKPVVTLNPWTWIHLLDR